MIAKNKNNLVTKFRAFWKGLGTTEKEYLWDIMTALRGSDTGVNDDVKYMTTARIRGELLGENYSRGYTFPTFTVAKNMTDTWAHPGESYKAQKVKAHFQSKPAHFKGHIRNAIKALCHYRPKSAMRDLEKFLRMY